MQRTSVSFSSHSTHVSPHSVLTIRSVARLRMQSGSLPVTVFSGARARQRVFPSLVQRRWKPLFEINRRDWSARRHGERFAWLRSSNDSFSIMIGSGILAPAPRIVGREAVKRGAALCEITKKNLMLMKMPCSTFVSFFLPLSLSLFN